MKYLERFPLTFSAAIIGFLQLVAKSNACVCGLMKPEDAFCKADWVAHVLIAARYDNQQMPSTIGGNNFPNIRYGLNYTRMFKISKDMPITTENKVLMPLNAYTPSTDSLCGLILEPGHEYLLSGRYVNSTLLLQLCGQILPEDPQEAKKHDILEWDEVPEKLRRNLGMLAFDKLCAELSKPVES